MGIIARTAKIVLTWPANHTVGPDGYYIAYGSAAGDGGAIDYDNRLIGRKIRPWPDGRYPGGYGSGLYGRGGYGHGYYGGAGYGSGMYGRGPYGRGARTLQATSGPKADGSWNTVVVAYDAAGNADPSGDRDTELVALAGTPEPCGAPSGAWAGGTLTLSFALSTDDEAA